MWNQRNQSKKWPPYLVTPTQVEQTAPHKQESDLPMQLITGT